MGAPLAFVASLARRLEEGVRKHLFAQELKEYAESADSRKRFTFRQRLWRIKGQWMEAPREYLSLRIELVDKQGSKLSSTVELGLVFLRGAETPLSAKALVEPRALRKLPRSQRERFYVCPLACVPTAARPAEQAPTPSAIGMPSADSTPDSGGEATEEYGVYFPLAERVLPLKKKRLRRRIRLLPPPPRIRL